LPCGIKKIKTNQSINKIRQPFHSMAFLLLKGVTCATKHSCCCSTLILCGARHIRNTCAERGKKQIEI
jgi:hypothetical protein